MLISALFASITLLTPASAAQCCGALGQWDETAVWELRQKLCSNPWGGAWVDGGYEYKVEIKGLDTTYSLWARDTLNNFLQLLGCCREYGDSVQPQWLRLLLLDVESW